MNNINFVSKCLVWIIAIVLSGCSLKNIRGNYNGTNIEVGSIKSSMCPIYDNSIEKNKIKQFAAIVFEKTRNSTFVNDYIDEYLPYSSKCIKLNDYHYCPK